MYKNRLPGKLILRDYFQENRTSRRPFLLLRISFPGRPIFIQFVPAEVEIEGGGLEEEDEDEGEAEAQDHHQDALLQLHPAI